MFVVFIIICSLVATHLRKLVLHVHRTCAGRSAHVGDYETSNQ